jgi:hypothetical protein
VWRVGRKLGRTLYKDDICVGMVDTPELARAIVLAMNAKEVIKAACLVVDAWDNTQPPPFSDARSPKQQLIDAVRDFERPQ